MEPILPGATLGILGGGQLGRMTAMAARTLGYDVWVLDPDPTCPAGPLATRLFTAPFTDASAAGELAAGCAAVTVEIEKIPLPTLERAASRSALRPAASVLHLVQDRSRQKRWLASHDFPVGPFRPAANAEELSSAVRELGGPCIAKINVGGYDGRGQAVMETEADGRAAWSAIGGAPCVVERRLDLAEEISVLVARGPDGPLATYPPARNHHERGILAWSAIPARLEPARVTAARSLAEKIAAAAGVVGLLAVEMFITREGALLVNELAPRPHNSFHHTESAAVTSQFEQLVRAVCGLPLGSTEIQRPGAIANLLGDLWTNGSPPRFDLALAVPAVRLHLYGKREARPGRKMGHLSATAETAESALRLVSEAHRILGERG